MSEIFFEDDYSEQLTRVYVALAMAQDATKRWVDQKPEYEPLKGLVTTLDVTKMLLEEILQKSMPGEPVIPVLLYNSSEMIM